MKRSVKLLLVTATLASPTMPGAVQTAAFAQNAAAGAGQPAATPAPAVTPVVQVWRREAARELLAYVDAIGAEGRIVYIVRDPIRRIESHLAHDHAVGRLAARDYDKAALEMGRFVSWSDYGRQIAPWIEAFGRSNVLLVCFEDFVANRHRIGREVAAFVGLDPELMVPRTAIANARGQQRVARTRWLSAFIEGDFYSNAVRRALPKTVRSKVRHLLSRNFTSEEVTLSDQTLDALQERLRHVPDEVRALGLDVKGWTT